MLVANIRTHSIVAPKPTLGFARKNHPRTNRMRGVIKQGHFKSRSTTSKNRWFVLFNNKWCFLRYSCPISG